MPLEVIIIGLIILGFLLILIEIFLVPGFNIFGIFGFIMIVLGIILAYSKLDLRIANFIMVTAIIVSIILVRIIVKSKTWQRIVLDEQADRSKGFHSSNENLFDLVGKKGIAYTPLRPAGIAMIEDQKIDVVTEGNFIEKSQGITVIQVEGNRVVVREIDNSPTVG